jgi:dihydrofolate reductase
MAEVTVDVGISVDGFVAGPEQSLEHPMGLGTEHLHRWMFETPDENSEEIAAIVDAGAFIMGRNMFGPIRGEWDEPWEGWWGEEPPYHGPVFVLTHHERPPLEMAGGTVFHFVTSGIDGALSRAREAAGNRPVSIAGGASTINQYLEAGAVDVLRLHIAPLILGAGERLFTGVGALPLTPLSSRTASLVTHVTYRLDR